MSTAEPRTPATTASADLSLARGGLSGFFLSGLLLALPGAILPAWGYHVQEEFLTVGNFFLSMYLGLMLSIVVARYWLKDRSPKLLVTACAVALASLLLMALLPPGLPAAWRMAGMAGVGVAAGLLNRGIFHAISGLYRHDPAATVNLAGIFFGTGCVAVCLLVAGAYYVYTVTSILVWIALIPGFFLGGYVKLSGKVGIAGAPQRPESAFGFHEAFREAKSPAAVLLALLLFFQFGNEWSLAGWLPLLLTKRVGVSPASSLLMLAVYWLALLIGRVGISALLPRVAHGKLLGASVLAALFGCIVLAMTDNRFGAISGILLVGAGFAPVYPLVVERIGGRFPSYHPGFFNSIFSVAISGGLLAPWSLGFFVDRWGAWAVIAVPLLGSLMVCLLVILLWAEAKLSAYS